mgnify:CR=1 FL=1
MNGAVPLAPSSQLAPWRWRDGLGGLWLGACTSVLVLLLRPQWLQGWQGILAFWRARLGLDLGAAGTMPVPSGQLLLATATAVALGWWLAGRWPERRWPLRAVVRGLCVVQASACLFFALAPARFPYGLSQHLDTLLTLGSEFMVIVPLMLGLGWGVLRLPWQLKLLGPLAVLLYFSLWLPHQVVLHAWVLTQASVLFMPVLFLCFGLLLDCWLFISLYAWLVSLTPRTPQPADRP